MMRGSTTLADTIAAASELQHEYKLTHHSNSSCGGSQSFEKKMEIKMGGVISLGHHQISIDVLINDITTTVANGYKMEASATIHHILLVIDILFLMGIDLALMTLELIKNYLQWNNSGMNDDQP